MKTNVKFAHRVVDFDLSDLPDGEYRGTWGGYEVTINMDTFQLELRTEEGIRTPAAPCVVYVENGIARVEAG